MRRIATLLRIKRPGNFVLGLRPGYTAHVNTLHRCTVRIFGMQQSSECKSAHAALALKWRWVCALIYMKCFVIDGRVCMQCTCCTLFRCRTVKLLVPLYQPKEQCKPKSPSGGCFTPVKNNSFQAWFFGREPDEECPDIICSCMMERLWDELSK